MRVDDYLGAYRGQSAARLGIRAFLPTRPNGLSVGESSLKHTLWSVRRLDKHGGSEDPPLRWVV